MTELLSLASGAWGYIAAGVGILAALAATYFGGKKIGTVQTQAKADVATANQEAETAEKVTAVQTETIKAVTDAKATNDNLSDSAARERMQSSKYNDPD